MSMAKTERRSPKENFTFKEAYDMFDGRLPPELRTHSLSEDLLRSLALVATRLPKNVVEWAMLNVIFVSSTDTLAHSISFKTKPFPVSQVSLKPFWSHESSIEC